MNWPHAQLFAAVGPVVCKSLITAKAAVARRSASEGGEGGEGGEERVRGRGEGEALGAWGGVACVRAS